MFNAESANQNRSKTTQNNRIESRPSLTPSQNKTQIHKSLTQNQINKTETTQLKTNHVDNRSSRTPLQNNTPTHKRSTHNNQPNNTETKQHKTKQLSRLARNAALSLAVVLVALLVKHDFSIVHRGSVGLAVAGVLGHENFEAVVDNYVYMHNALRNDLEGMIALSSSTQEISDRFGEWKDTLERHSKVEDEIMIPALVARMKHNTSAKRDSLPHHVVSASSHRNIVALSSQVEALQTKDNAESRTAALIALRDALEEHLQEEEREVMPRMLQYFTYRELWALDSIIINPNLGYCPPDVLSRITFWWFRHIGVAEGWNLLKNFVRAGNQPPMTIEKWEDLRAPLSALRDVPIHDLMS